MRVIALHHVNIRVNDVEQALAFYCGLLGCTIRPERPPGGNPGAWLNAGSQQLHLSKGEPPPPRGQHFALAIEDLDAAVAELRRAGVEVSAPFGEHRRQYMIRDPAGNGIELRDAD